MHRLRCGCSSGVRIWRRRTRLNLSVTASAIAILGAAFVAPARGQVSVPVQQVEAFENPPTNTHYAPINFNGSLTATDPSYPGITFHAQANTTDTQSSH